MNDKKKVLKKKIKGIKLGYILAFIVIIIVAIMGIKMILPSNSSKYGDRLEGIKKIKFGKDEKNKIVEKIKSSDKVTEAKIEVQGKRIDIIFNVVKDASVDDAKAIGNDSLGSISDEVKGFYDVQYIVTKKDEDVQKTTKEDGSVEEKTVFPIMGYKKNTRTNGIVWTK